MFAGSIRIKNKMSIQPVRTVSLGINKPTAAATSIKPVKYIIPVLKGIKAGNIIAIPLVKAKCPMAVNNNITDIAIRPDRAKLYFFLIIRIVKSEIINAASKIINGFIFRSNLLNNFLNDYV